MALGELFFTFGDHETAALGAAVDWGVEDDDRPLRPDDWPEFG